jgi:hypothetical protein
MAHAPEIYTHELKPFTKNLLARDETPFFLWSDLENKANIYWRGIDKDIDVFIWLIKFIEHTRTVKDTHFRQYVVNEIEHVLDLSEIFQQMKSPYIRVAGGHKNRTPYDHTLDVIRCLNTEHLVTRERIFVRLCALYHDIGKAISAGLSGIEIDSLMKDYAPQPHSYPDHRLLSTLALQALMKDERVEKAWEEAVGMKYWPTFLNVVYHHHFFEKVSPNPPQDELTRWLVEEEPDLLLMLFVFCRADIAAIPAYHYFWREKNYAMISWLRKVWCTLDDKLRLDFWNTLLLSKQFSDLKDLGGGSSAA